MSKTLVDIDLVSKRAENSIESVIKILNFKSGVDKNIVSSLADVKKSRLEAVNVLNDIDLGIEYFINESIEQSIANKKLNENQAETLRNIYLRKNKRNTDMIINDLLRRYEYGLKLFVLANKSKKKLSYSPDNGYTFDASGRKIRISEKHRRNTRKLSLDLTNDVEAYSAYYKGKNLLYGIKNGIKTYFSVDDYLKTDLRDKMFHPNSKMLLQIEE